MWKDHCHTSMTNLVTIFDAISRLNRIQMLQLLKYLTSHNIHSAKAYFAKGRKSLSLTSVVSLGPN